MLKCKFCFSDWKNEKSLRNHERQCKHNPNAWQNPRFSNLEKCPHCGKGVKNANIHFENCRHHPEWVDKSHIWTDERRRKQSEGMKRAVRENPDSYSKNNVCGRVKNIEYREGVILKGTWEVRVAEWLDNQNIMWENEANPQPYYWEEKWKLYFPDFYLPDYNCYIEVKGYKTNRDIAKWNYFPHDLLIFEKEAISKIDTFDVEYALHKYKWD